MIINFSTILSLIIVFVIVFSNFKIIESINFSLIVIFYMSLLNFLKAIGSNFNYKLFIKADVFKKNHELSLKIKEIFQKNRALIKNNNGLRRDLILQNLKNAHLTLVISSLTKNDIVFNNTIKELENLGITNELMSKYKNLLNLITLIDEDKVEMIVLGEEKKLIFKEKISDSK